MSNIQRIIDDEPYINESWSDEYDPDSVEGEEHGLTEEFDFIEEFLGHDDEPLDFFFDDDGRESGAEPEGV